MDKGDCKGGYKNAWKLVELILGNFGKAAFYTPEEQARYGGVNLNCCERILRGANIAYGLACARRTCV